MIIYMDLLEKIFYYFRRFNGRFIYPAVLRSKGVKIGNRCVFMGKPIVSIHQNSKIILGDRCNIISSSVDTALGVNHPVILRTLAKTACIDIGQDVGISGSSICALESIKIGAKTLLGSGVRVFDNDFHPLNSVQRYRGDALSPIDADPVIIGSNVFVGTNVIILKGVSIGNNTVIGAGSVVTSSIPSNTFAAGNPAKVLRSDIL
jgi:acetyltransferase-like isoleucine patch superfamily enzyme